MSQTVDPGGASHGLGKAAGSPCEEEHSCQGASAAFYCRDCGTYQCSACETSLHSTRELKLHNREALVSTTRYFRLLVYQCSSQRQSQRAVLSQRSKHSCGFNYILSTTSKENCIPKSGGAPLFHPLARTLYIYTCA